MKPIFTFVFLLLTFLAIAQPANDNCGGLIDLGPAPACPEGVFYNNVNATASDIGFGNNPSCFNGGTTQNDVWFAFSTVDTIQNYTITVTGMDDGMGTDGLVNPQIALYRGDCETDGLAELACVSSPLGETTVELDAEGLTPNITYFIRINDYSASATPNWGSFQLCVEETPPENNIDDGGSTLSSGTLYDTGGPDGDYSNNENNIFTICPSQPSQCITFTLESYFIEPGGFDQLVFYDGAQPGFGNIIGQVGGFDFAAGGGVCYEVQATSGCMTVQFISNGSVTFEGFAGSWTSSTLPCESTPITVAGGTTEAAIVDFISTPQTLVEITDIVCPPNAYGVFAATDDSNLGLERGLLLTTGSINWAPGPNTSTGFGNPQANNGAPGDADLDYLSEVFGEGSTSNDACILELDVFVATDELTFEYIFASEEYPEYVNSQFNDIFAFLVSGPGIVGDPNMNDQLNIAVLPNGSGTPVQINSVNNLINWEYYRSNEPGQTLQYDGLTADFMGVKKSLTARALVTPCNTYHLKLAIADRGDFELDSGVFISELKGGTPNIAVIFNSGIDYLLEDCTNTPDEIIIRLNNPLEDTTTYNIVLGGTATVGEDYLLDLPASITFLPGETEASFPITPLSDLFDEGTETIEISLTNDFGCGEVTYITLVINLEDELNVEINAGQDTAFVCQDSSIVLQAIGAANYFWSPPALFSDPLGNAPLVTPTESAWVSVVGNVGPCSDTDSIYVRIIDPVITISALDPTTICQGEQVRLQATDNVGHLNLLWTPGESLDDAGSATPLASPQVTTTYTATVDVAGCLASDTITIDVNAFHFPEMMPDTTICENYSVRLAEFILPDTVTTSYSWTPATGLDDPTSSGPLATPAVTTTYQLIATSDNGACADTASITVTVLPADVDLMQPDTAFICLGDTLALTATTSTGLGDNLVWSPDDGTLSDTSGLTVTVNPTVTTQYLVTFAVGQCVVLDSVTVRVDSLPDLSLMADPEKEFYCEGELVTLKSTTYEPSFFPDIEHQWLEGLGYQTPDTLFNMVVIARDTFTYQRVTTNRACVDTAEITIFVIDAEEFPITPDTTICPGESVQLFADFQGQGDLSWEPGDNLSCTDCPNPVATPPATVTYTVKAEKGDCILEKMVTITVDGPPVISFNNVPVLCAGQAGPIPLLLNPDPADTYLWTSPEDPDFSSNSPFLTVQPATTTTYQLTVTNDCGTVSDDLTVIVVEDASLVLPDDLLICEGDDITVTAMGNAPAGVPQSYTWRINGEIVSTEAALNLGFLTGNTLLTVTYTYGPGAGCESITEDLLVTVNEAPSLEFPTDTEICPGETVGLNIDVDDDTQYSWTGPDLNSNDPNPIVSPLQTSTYLVTATTAGCPPLEGSLTLTVIPPVTLTLPADFTVCAGEEVSITPVLSAAEIPLEVFNWSWPAGSSSEEILVDVPLVSTTYTLVYDNSCQVLTDSVQVTVVGEDLAVTLSTDSAGVTSYPYGDDITLVAAIFPGDISGLTFSWLEDGVEIGTTTGPQFTFSTLGSTIGEHIYSVVITSADGCTAEAGINLTIEEPQYRIPNVFTPNGDSMNDAFGLLADGVIPITEFRIYNRWGQTIYEQNSDDASWDGTYKGEPAPSDTYIYLISFRIGTRVVTEKGDVTLVR